MRQTACDLSGTKTVVQDFVIFYNELGAVRGRNFSVFYLYFAVV